MGPLPTCLEAHLAEFGGRCRIAKIAERIGANGPLAVRGILATLRETEMLSE